MHVRIVGKKSITVTFIGLLSAAGGCSPDIVTRVVEIAPISSNDASQFLFDDFSYSTIAEMTANGWIVRSGSGWPGVVCATFRPENISFVDYPDPAGNRLLRMTSSTDGTRENTFQTQICHQRKYLEGTYAA